MRKKFKIGLLATIDSPLLPQIINSLLLKSLNDIVVICDKKTMSKKDKNIWHERTNGQFSSSKKWNPDIFSFENEYIPYYFVNNHNSISTIEIINSLDIDILVNAGTPRKLLKEVLSATFYGVLNIHPGVLPRYRGCSAVEWAIFNDDKVGNTAHIMSEDYDGGPVIEIETYNFPKDSDYVSIRSEIYARGFEMTGKILKKIYLKEIKTRDFCAQDESEAMYWKPIPEPKFKVVVDKLSAGNYVYQNA